MSTPVIESAQSRNESRIQELLERISELEEQNGNLCLIDQACRRNSNLFSALLKNCREGILLTTLDCRIIRVIKGLTDYQPEELIGFNIVTLMHPEDQPAVREAYDRLREGRQKSVSVEVRLIRGDGSVIWLDVLVTDMFDDPDVQAIVCNYTNITPRKQHELALGELAAIVEYSEYAIFSKDLDGIILTWNRSAEKLFGYSASEIIGRPVLTLVPNDRRDEEHRLRTRASAGELIGEVRTEWLTKAGVRIPILLNIVPLIRKQGTVCGISHISRLAKS